MSSEEFAKRAGQVGTGLSAAGALFGNADLSRIGQVIGLGAGAFDSPGSVAQPFDVLKTPSMRLDRDRGEFKLSRSGALSDSDIVEQREAAQDNIAKVQQSQRALRTGLEGLKTRVSAFSPVFQNLRDESALLRARTDDDFSNIASALLDLSGETSDLRGEVRPGFGRLTQLLKESIRNQRDEAVGDLRASLSRRRVLGSSFAEDAENRVKSEFTKLEGEALSQAAIQEIQLSEQLIAREQNIQETVAGITERGANIVTNLLNFDAQTLQAEAQSIALEAGLSGQQASLLGQELEAIKASYGILADTLNRELVEFDTVGGIANQRQKLLNDAAQFDALLAIKNAMAQGKTLEGLGKVAGTAGGAAGAATAIGGALSGGGSILSTIGKALGLSGSASVAGGTAAEQLAAGFLLPGVPGPTSAVAGAPLAGELFGSLGVPAKAGVTAGASAGSTGLGAGLSTALGVAAPIALALGGYSMFGGTDEDPQAGIKQVAATTKAIKENNIDALATLAAQHGGLGILDAAASGGAPRGDPGSADIPPFDAETAAKYRQLRPEILRLADQKAIQRLMSVAEEHRSPERLPSGRFWRPPAPGQFGTGQIIGGF